MIIGRVENDEARVPLTLRDRFGGAHTVNAVIDTGSKFGLVLPPDLFEAYGRGCLQETIATVAGGRDLATWTVNAEVLWNGQPTLVIAALLDEEPLIGMPLLANHRLTIDVTDGGRVSIEPLAV